jgi:hypothetical protein
MFINGNAWGHGPSSSSQAHLKHMIGREFYAKTDDRTHGFGGFHRVRRLDNDLHQRPADQQRVG